MQVNIAVFLATLALASYVCAQQTPFSTENTLGRAGSTGGNANRVLTPELKQLVQDVVDNGTVPGLSLAVVHDGDVVEFETWGRKTEDGDEMTVDVSPRITVYRSAAFV